MTEIQSSTSEKEVLGLDKMQQTLRQSLPTASPDESARQGGPNVTKAVRSHQENREEQEQEEGTRAKLTKVGPKGISCLLLANDRLQENAVVTEIRLSREKSENLAPTSSQTPGYISKSWSSYCIE